MQKFLTARKPFLLIAFALAVITGALNADASSCYPKPLSDARVRSNYAWMKSVARMSPAQLEKLYRKARGEVSSPAALRQAALRYTSKPVSFHVNEMRKYRLACAQADRGGGSWERAPKPECTAPYHCSGGTHCLDGKCVRIDSPGGDCHRGNCPTGYVCMSDNLCH